MTWGIVKYEEADSAIANLVLKYVNGILHLFEQVFRHEVSVPILSCFEDNLCLSAVAGEYYTS